MAIVIQDRITCQYDVGYGLLLPGESSDNTKMNKAEPLEHHPGLPPYAVLLRRLMSEHKLSDNALANKATKKPGKKVTQPTVTRLRNGEILDPREATIAPIAEYFGITTEDFRAGRHPQDSKPPEVRQDKLTFLKLSKDGENIGRSWELLSDKHREMIVEQILCFMELSDRNPYSGTKAQSHQRYMDSFERLSRELKHIKFPHNRRSSDKAKG